MRTLLLTTVVFFSVLTCSHAQITTAQMESSTPGEILKLVAETLQTQPGNVSLLRKLETELKGILAADSSTVFKSEVEAKLDLINENLAYHDLMIAAFYMDQNRSLRGAASRLQNITQRYPKFSKMDEALFRLGVVSQRSEKNDQAVRYYWTLICNFPRSEYVNKSFNQLNRIGVSSWEGCKKFELSPRSP